VWLKDLGWDDDIARRFEPFAAQRDVQPGRVLIEFNHIYRVAIGPAKGGHYDDVRSVRLQADLPGPAKAGHYVQIERSSTLGIEGDRNERLVNICRHFGATTYVSGEAARGYLDEALFARHAIRVEWQQYAPPVYPQLHGEFVPYLSALDLVLNCGDASALIAFGGMQ